MKYFIALLIVSAVAGSFAASVAKPTCGAKASTKVIELLTPSFPPRECVYHINSYSKYVCQLRIDFGMTLAQPSLVSIGNGLQAAKCNADYMEVNGMRFCGIESNTHIYVPFNTTDGVSNVDVIFSLAARAGATSLPNPQWKLTVTQLECPTGAAMRSVRTVPLMKHHINNETDEDEMQNEVHQQYHQYVSDDHEDIEAPMSRATSFTDGYFLAPPGCLQYYPQSKGVIRSFNFNNGYGMYSSDMNYAICFRRTSKTQGLELKSFFFQIGSAHGDATIMALDNYCYPSLPTAGDSEDYLMVAQGEIIESHLRATYFCGDSRQQALTITSTNPGPLMVVFNSDGHSNTHEAGFDLNYKLL